MKENEIAGELLEKLLKLQSKEGYFEDTVHKLVRPRAAAEIAKSALLLGKEKSAEKAFNWLLKTQAKNGSWHEVHPDFDEESTVATAIISLALAKAFEKTRNKKYLESALKAGKFALSKEFTPGYFIKSYSHYSDVLNLDANCAALFARLFRITKQKIFSEARDRAIFNISRWQFKDGALPYSSPERTFPYEKHNFVRDPHYHAITLYYLLLADPRLENKHAKICAEKAIKWLSKNLHSKGFDWTECKNTFSIGLIGGYGFAAYCLDFFNAGREKEICLKKISEAMIEEGMEKYEKPRLFETIKGIILDIIELDWRKQTGYSFLVRLNNAKERLKIDLLFRNRKDFSLYYSAQALDCLTETAEKSGN